MTFFSAGAEQMLGYRAAEVVGFHSIADFIDPAQIDERRQTIDAMRTALEPVDAETAAEVPWTATRKDGQQRRCVVRVRALPVPTPDLALDEEWVDEAEHAEKEADARPTASTTPGRRPGCRPTAATWWWPSTSPSGRSWPPTGSGSTPFRRR